MKNPTVIIAFMALAVLLPSAHAQVPKGYKQVRITDDPTSFCSFPRINNKGQVVFVCRTPGNGSDANDEIFLYDAGKLLRLTNDQYKDSTPDINDDGTIVWNKGIGPEGPYGPTYEIFMRDPSGNVIQLTDNDVDDYSPYINNRGQIAWDATLAVGCEGTVDNHDVFYFDGANTAQITFDSARGGGISNQVSSINEHGDFVWTRYDFCSGEAWTSEIMMWHGGEVLRLSPDGADAPQVATLNDSGLVVWMHNANHDGRYGIQSWKDGIVSDITDWGANPAVNNNGDIAFYRSHRDENAFQVWLYHGGGFRRLTFDASSSYVPTMNDSGSIAFQFQRPFVTDITMLSRTQSLSPAGRVP